MVIGIRRRSRRVAHLRHPRDLDQRFIRRRAARFVLAAGGYHHHLGLNTWAAFGGTEDDAVVDGDFAVSEDELQPVLRALRSGGVNVVAIHSHMTHEQPRILFFHYWGRGSAKKLADAVKGALLVTGLSGVTTPLGSN
jgi:hypothetical protein